LRHDSGSDYIPEQHATKGDEHADDDGRRGGAGDIGGLLEHETHGVAASDARTCTA
jgi:hypothetical protein